MSAIGTSETAAKTTAQPNAYVNGRPAPPLVNACNSTASTATPNGEASRTAIVLSVVAAGTAALSSVVNAAAISDVATSPCPSPSTNTGTNPPNNANAAIPSTAAGAMLRRIDGDVRPVAGSWMSANAMRLNAALTVLEHPAQTSLPPPQPAGAEESPGCAGS